MTKQEFNIWTEKYFTAFPDAKAWLTKCDNPAGALATWFDCLKGCENHDVNQATARMIRGELAPIEAFQRERTALHVRAYADRMRDDRNKRLRAEREREGVSRKQQQFRKSDGPSMASMFTVICKFRTAATEQGLVGREIDFYAERKFKEWLEQHSHELQTAGVPGEEESHADNYSHQHPQ